VAWKVEPDDGFGSRQTKIKVAGVVAVHHPYVASHGFRHPLAKMRSFGLHPSGVPVSRIKMYDWKVKALADLTRER